MMFGKMLALNLSCMNMNFNSFDYFEFCSFIYQLNCLLISKIH